MIKGILNGLKTYGQSFGLISKLGLWKYFAIPMVISFVTAVTIGLSAWGFSDNLGHWIARIWPWEWGAQTFDTIAQIFSALLIIAVGLILYKHIIMAFSAPFMSPVSEKIEKYLKGENHTHRETSNTEQLVRGIRINVRNLAFELLLTLPILLLNLIPFLGSIVATVLLFLTQAYYAGFGNMDYTLERHYKYRQSVDFVKKNKGQAIGNGMVFMLFLLIPIVGIILVLPVSVTAATVQTVRLLDEEKMLREGKRDLKGAV
ncbi:coproporphyrinogen III oxidase [Dokdonia sinensis]|uniref:Coproporphyrinogen III oxidase n=1 Tax=Dokdonia sinensis TaxID=2479847 RepID=A0A3M0FZR4_9FLAO|nr:EI24 domain-containing protein [Dokdonia sinensis]RMB57995.1 coproporphyrinogen III oxidase [Dokdonia sinensis]